MLNAFLFELGEIQQNIIVFVACWLLELKTICYK